MILRIYKYVKILGGYMINIKKYKFNFLVLFENLFCSASAIAILYFFAEYIKVVLTNI